MIKSQVFQINPQTFEDTSLSAEDSNLIVVQQQDEQFDVNNDQVELYVYLPNNNLVYQDYNYSGWKTYQDPSLPNTGKLQDLYLNPVVEGSLSEVTNGDVYVIYNFVKNQLLSSTFQPLYISQISSDRTEVALKTNNLPDDVLSRLTTEFITERSLTPYFSEFYLNFGNNIQLLAVNIKLDQTNPNDVSVLIKLYEPLPTNLNEKSQCWIQTLVADAVGYRVNYETIVELPDTRIFLRQPNYNLGTTGKVANSTNFQNLTTLRSTRLTSSIDQVDSLLVEKGVELNIDYSDYSNFVHFSSAATRLSNFYYKASLIETYQNDINAMMTTPATTARSESIAVKQGKISQVITEFDGYDYFLYYNSESKAWPKTNSTPPYTLASTGSAAVLSWIGFNFAGVPTGFGQFASASVYDSENENNLLSTVPDYLLDDPANQPYQIFIEMIGQHFDTLYNYTEGITEKYNADNRLEYGVSKDLIADVLRSFGIKIYENNFSIADLYSGLIGLTPSGSTLLLPDISTIYPVTEPGIEYIQTIISASSSQVTLDDLNKSIYKRLYHNLPLLVKKKGTLAGLELLRTIYGLPDTILRISEFGGKDRSETTYDHWQNTFNYAFDTKGKSAVKTRWQINSSWGGLGYPQTVTLRIKPGELPTSNIPYSQSIWTVEPKTSEAMHLLLTYQGTGYSSGSYSGASIDPQYQYAKLDYIPNAASSSFSASVTLPFFNRDWWTISFGTDFATGRYTLIAKTSNDNEIGFQASASVFPATSGWGTFVSSSFASASIFNGQQYNGFSGSIQEIRYYTAILSGSVFDNLVMNPGSIQGNILNGGPDILAFRGALGGDLFTGSVSIHPKVSGSWPTTASFNTGNGFAISGSGQFIPNRENYYFSEVIGGVKNIVSNKVRLEDTTEYGTVLSNQISIQQSPQTGNTYGVNVNYMEVGFSPTNEINDDINSQIGFFNIGEYIGDPRFISESNYRYPDLNTLSENYFKKYVSSYNLQDYFRIIKFFDNSLFKIIKDFIPARTSAATGAIVKQHLLERNRQRPAQISYSQPYYTGSVTSLPRDYQTGSIEVFTGGPGGSVNNWTNISQSWTSSLNTRAGIVTNIQSSEYEFYNGEYSGSVIGVIQGQLQDNPLLGSAFRVGIPSLQNLVATRSSSFIAACVELSGGSYVTSTSSAVFPFNLANLGTPYYSTSTYQYTPLYPVQVDIQVSVSASFQQQFAADAEAFNLDVYLVKTTNGTRTILGLQSFNTGSDAGPFPANNPFQFTKTFPNVYVQSGSIYTVEYVGGCNASGDDVGSFLFSTTGTSWTVTVDNLYAQSTYYLDPTVYTQQNFPGNINQYQDYNALLNNVYSNRVSNTYYDVDYSTDALTPVNLLSILSQSAIYAQVQDSNYVSGSAWSTARYEGTKVTSKFYNVYTPGDVSYGETAAIDNYCDYIAQFDWIGGSDPQYPGGGNIHIIGLIKVDGTVIGLDGSNNNLLLVEQMFKQGDLATAYISSYSSNQSIGEIEIETGGALYETILIKTGSSTGLGFSYIYTDSTGSQSEASYDFPAFTSASIFSLTDTGSLGLNQGWLQGSLTASNGSGRTINSVNGGGSLKFYDKVTGTYPISRPIPYRNTFLPLQYADFIRFGKQGVNISQSMDYSFDAQGLYRIDTITAATSSTGVSTLNIKPTLTNKFPSVDLTNGSSIDTQNFRIFRRVPNETFVVVKEKPIYPGGGLLIPVDFNPNYNPLDVARKAGITF